MKIVKTFTFKIHLQDVVLSYTIPVRKKKKNFLVFWPKQLLCCFVFKVCHPLYCLPEVLEPIGYCNHESLYKCKTKP